VRLKTRSTVLLVLGLGAVFTTGCSSGSNQPPFPELHAVKGVVQRGGKPVTGGAVRFTAEPTVSEFMITSEVATDGTFTLTTVRTTDKSGERKTGVAAGSYKVTYIPPAGDQTAGGSFEPIDLPKPVSITGPMTDLKLELPTKK